MKLIVVNATAITEILNNPSDMSFKILDAAANI
jgi:hypothetical protein